MKKKIVSVLICVLMLVPMFLAPVGTTYAAGGDFWNTLINFMLGAGHLASDAATNAHESAMYDAQRNYYETLTHIANSDYARGQANNGTTNNYSVINNDNKTLNYITNNQYITKNYNTIIKHETYNSYYTNIENNHYYITYTPTFTNITYIGQTGTWDDRESFNLYFEMPDGRNSYYLTVEDIKGIVFNYDVSNYLDVVEDDGTLCLYHFDGNIYDHSYYHNNAVWTQGASTTYLESGAYNACLFMNSQTHSLQFDMPRSIGQGDYTLEFRFYNAIADNTNNPQLGFVYNETKPIDAAWMTTYDHNTYYTCTFCSARSLLDKTSVTVPNGPLYSDRHCSPTSSAYSMKCPSCLKSTSGTRSTYCVFKSFYYTQNAVAGKKTVTPYGLTDVLCFDGHDDITREKEFPYNTNLSGLSGHAYSSPLFNISSGDETILLSRFGAVVDMSNKVGSSVLFLNDIETTYTNSAGEWVSYAISRRNGTTRVYANGLCIAEYADNTSFGSSFVFEVPAGVLQYSYLDELRVTDKALYTADYYTPSSAPFDTNLVLGLPSPDGYGEKAILIQTGIPVTASRIGGVRPTYPSRGYVFVALDGDLKVSSIQVYNGADWVWVNGAIKIDGEWLELRGHSFADDVYIPPDDGGGGTDPGDGTDPGGDGGGGTDPGGDGGGNGGGSGSDVWSEVWETLKDAAGKIASFILKGIRGLFNFLKTGVEKLTEITEYGRTFGDFLGAAMPFIPPELITVIVTGIIIAIVIRIVRLLLNR